MRLSCEIGSFPLSKKKEYDIVYEINLLKYDILKISIIQEEM